jgi:hypothetical protein
VEDAAALEPHLAQLRLDRISLKTGRARIEATHMGEIARCRRSKRRLHHSVYLLVSQLP